MGLTTFTQKLLGAHYSKLKGRPCDRVYTGLTKLKIPTFQDFLRTRKSVIMTVRGCFQNIIQQYYDILGSMSTLLYSFIWLSSVFTWHGVLRWLYNNILDNMSKLFSSLIQPVKTIWDTMAHSVYTFSLASGILLFPHPLYVCVHVRAKNSLWNSACQCCI